MQPRAAPAGPSPFEARRRGERLWVTEMELRALLEIVIARSPCDEDSMG
jgi:hypothetical protein